VNAVENGLLGLNGAAIGRTRISAESCSLMKLVYHLVGTAVCTYIDSLMRDIIIPPFYLNLILIINLGCFGDLSPVTERSHLKSRRKNGAH
jgi:hypothetical protein